MRLNLTLRWLAMVWRTEVKDKTIQNCFTKNTIIRNKQTEDLACQEDLQLRPLYNEVIKRLAREEIICEGVVPLDEILDPLDGKCRTELYQEDMILGL